MPKQWCLVQNGHMTERDAEQHERTEAAGMAVGVYARISRDDTGDALGVARQIEDCEALAARNGWQVREHYVDNDVSASKAVPRPEYQRLLADLQRGVISGLVVYDLDRLTRKPAELEHIIELADAHRFTLANVSGDVDLITSNGRMLARIKGAVARQEADRIGERVKRQKHQRAQRGEYQGGRYRLYGYTRDMDVIEAEAEVVREAFARRAAGESTRSIAADLAARGLTTVTGGPFKASSVDHLLRKAAYAGLREYRGEVVGRGRWAAIVTEDDLAACREAMRVSAQREGHNERRHLLSGLLRCGVVLDEAQEGRACRAPLSGSHRAINGGEKRTRYACAAGGHSLSTYAEWVETLVVGYVLDQHARRLDQPADADAVKAAREVEDALADIESLWARYRAGEVPDARFERMLDAKEARLRRVEQQAPRRRRFDHLLAQRQWSDLNLGERRGLVAQYVDSVTLLPGRGEHHTRLRIHGTDGTTTVPTSTSGTVAGAPVANEQLVRMALGRA